MRIVSFDRLWSKLTTDRFTTFRFARKDKPLAVGEYVQLYYKQRSPKDSSKLGVAIVDEVELRWVMESDPYKMCTGYADTFGIKLLSDSEAKRDGFESQAAMVAYMKAHYRLRTILEPMVRITLIWDSVWLYVAEQKPHIAKEWAEMLAGHLPKTAAANRREYEKRNL